MAEPRATTTSGWRLDSDGYAMVEFIEPPFPVRLEPMADRAKKGYLTPKDLLDLEYTDLIRLAGHPAAADFVAKTLNLRGVLIRPEYSLYPYQIAALAWMRSREEMDLASSKGVRGGMISLEMGLGKSLTAVIHTATRPKGTFPTLIIASYTVIIAWKRDCIEKFFFPGEPKVLYLHPDFIGAGAMKAIGRADILEYDIVFTTYDTCMSVAKNYFGQCLEMGDDHSLMKGKVVSVHLRTASQADMPDERGAGVIYGTPWERVIADESQRFANPETKTYKAMMAIYGRYKWCLTGTPFRNTGEDIFSQLRFVGYTGVQRVIDWKRSGLYKFREHSLRDVIYTMSHVDANVILPPKTKIVTPVFLKDRELQAYQMVLGATQKAYDRMMEKLCSFSCVLAMFTRLRQCAIAPYLLTAQSKREKLTKAQKEADDEALKILQDVTDENSIGAWCHDQQGQAGIHSAKISATIDLISRVPDGEKVLVFSMFTSCLDLLGAAMEKRLPDVRFAQIDGDVKGPRRDDLLAQFRSDPTIKALFLTYKVGSEGLNLTEANHVIPIEPWWTDAVHDQADSRAHRNGQTKPVFVHLVRIQNTIEQRIDEICKGKKELASSYLNGTEKPLGKVGLDKYTLGRILGIWDRRR